MMSEKMADQLNEQVREEFFAAYLYLQMAACFDSMGLKVFAQRFRQQFAEEQEHAMKIFDYLLERGMEVELRQLDKPQADFASAEEMVAAALNHEKHVTGRFNMLAELAEQDNDRATRSFLNWYIDEQVEEEASMGDLLQVLKMAGPQQIFQVEGWLARQMH